MRLNQGPLRTVDFIRNTLAAHVDEHQIDKWIAYRAAEATSIDWVIADGPTHEGWVSLAAQEMSLHVAATGMDGDLTKTDAHGFEAMVQEVMSAHREVIIVADHLEAELLRSLGLSLHTSRGAR